MTIPDGYTLESVPEAINAVLPDRKGNFNYSVTPQGEHLMITYIFDLKDTLFGPTEYPSLKMLYDMMAEILHKCLLNER